MTIVIHHNPRCSKSRQTLQLIRAAGIEPVVIEYLKVGWTRPQLQALFAVAGISPREALRAAQAKGVVSAEAEDDAVLEAMVVHPELVERPIVACAKGVAICRPPERVHELL